MKYVRGFLNFWYDFFVGDAPEIALGVVVALVAVALLAKIGLSILWLLYPIGIGLVLGLSLWLYARSHWASSKR